MIRTDWLARLAAHTPDAPAFVWVPTGAAYTFAACNRLAAGLARALKATYGVQRGDRLAVLAENHLAHVLLFGAAQKAGFVLVPLNYRLAPAELQGILDDSAPSVLFAGDAYAERAAGLTTEAHLVPLHEVEALAADAAGRPLPPTRLGLDDPLMLLYTSGTTGQPKGVVYTHGMLAWNAVNTHLRLDLTSADRSVNAAPLYHTGGWHVLLTPFLHQGATTFLLDGFDAETVLDLCDAERLTLFWGVPTMLRLMAKADAFEAATLETVRYAVVGGEPMPEGLIRTWQAKGVPIRQGFGLTEVGVNCFSLPEADALRKIGSIGLPNFYVEARIVDEAGQDVPPDTPGELLLHGPVVTPGYWRDPASTAEAIDADGWFHTGDLVTRDDEGYFYVVGRKKDMYICGGENVYPAEVEAVLHAHPAVAEAAVVGVPDARWGEAGRAFVALAEGYSAGEDALLEHCRARLARYKIPREVHVLDALPKGHSGKVLKADLRDRGAAALEIERDT